MEVIVSDTGVEISTPRPKPESAQLVLNGLLFVVTLAVVIIGVRAHVTEGITAVNGVAFGLTLVWAVAGVVAARYSDRTTTPTDLQALLIGADALVAAIALTFGRLAQGCLLYTSRCV